jgi:CheY-like chemotaxis protein
VKILVVEDERDAREFVGRLFEECGASVITASSALEALVILRETPPEILVCDIGLPGMDGYDLIRQVRAGAHAETRSLPAIAVTAFARPEDRERAQAAGFQAHLAKPVEPSELMATVASLLAQGAKNGRHADGRVAC